MKIGLRIKSKKFMKLETPCVYGVSNFFYNTGCEKDCARDIPPEGKVKKHIGNLNLWEAKRKWRDKKLTLGFQKQGRNIRELGKENKCCEANCKD